MEHIADLFGRLRTALPQGKVLNERAELIQFFADAIGRPAKYIGVRLSHYSLSELYALQSAYKDRLLRDGKVTADKFWWWTTRTEVCES